MPEPAAGGARSGGGNSACRRHLLPLFVRYGQWRFPGGQENGRHRPGGKV